MTDSILTKLAVVVKDYSVYFLEEFKYFFSAYISTSGNNNYSITGGGMQEGIRILYPVNRISLRIS